MDGAGERLRLFKADMMDYASVAAAVAGCCGVFHVASPVPSTKPLNPDAEVLVPAVTGTRNVLTACHEANVRRVVVVSSVAAVIVSPGVPNNDDAVLDEDAWSDEDYCRATENWYYLSKTLAEREALAYAADKAGRLDVVTVCPPLVLGPLLQPTMNFSSSIVVKVLKGGHGITVPDKKTNVVDVRDVADALVLTFENPAASGRYICSAYQVKVSEIAHIVNGFYPHVNYPKFVAGEELKMVSSKKLQALGWKFRTLEECLRDSVDSYRAAGALK
ncbi:hypothetical protein GUJ93_ZPchr0006g40929 [Zizania palustris]|nr:hypothetical protein GUJ93_ZPchr0006g40929 [Zizania palustris]